MNCICYLTLFQITYSIGDMLIYVLYSEKTNSNLQADMNSSLHRTINQNESYFDVQLLEIDTASNLADILVAQQFFLTVDATFDLHYSKIINQYTEENSIINLMLSLDSSFDGEWQFFLHNSAAQHQQVAEMTINYFGWKNMAIISDEQSINVNIASSLEKMLKNRVSLKLILPQSINRDSVESLVGKIIKPNGIQMFYILEEGEIFINFIENLKNKNIYKKGAGVLGGSSSIWAASENGMLIYVEKGLETAKSYAEYEMLAIK
ncbi:unnamed protein product [Blepharisma stoltei]|uniref:Receptor ligand binding region domain-containing protein n=1 Tax=Blepharisma stoltei TaxID=1481888 RepID=A0AAU9JEY9_9CILI|nr:unnamed protein product [Blepharisma stoltei]